MLNNLRILIGRNQVAGSKVRKIDRKEQTAHWLLRAAKENIEAKDEIGRPYFVLREKPFIIHAETLNAVACAHLFPHLRQHIGGIDGGTVGLLADDGNICYVKICRRIVKKNIGQALDKGEGFLV